MKKRWKPRKDQNFYCIYGYGNGVGEYVWNRSYEDKQCLNWLGVYKTRAEAEAMVEKIKAFVTREIGEV